MAMQMRHGVPAPLRRGLAPAGGRKCVTASSGAGSWKAGMAELDSSLMLLEAGGGRDPRPQLAPPAGQAEGDEDLMPMVFLCAGCKRPVGDTLSWVTNDEETGCVVLRSECPAPPLRAAVSGRWSPLPPRRCLRQRLGGQGAEAVQAARRVRMVRRGDGGRARRRLQVTLDEPRLG